jgi:hypothetical protein
MTHIEDPDFVCTDFVPSKKNTTHLSSKITELFYFKFEIFRFLCRRFLFFIFGQIMTDKYFAIFLCFDYGG